MSNQNLKDINIHRFSYIQGFTMPKADQPNVLIPFPGATDPQKFSGIRMYNEINRFKINMDMAQMGACTLGDNKMASHTMRWVVIPTGYHAYPGQVPPPTLFDRYKSQRFAMIDDQFDFGNGNTFTAFGTGRTFPDKTGTESILSVGAIGNFTSGTGIFEGAWGAYVINGFISKDNEIKFEIFVRILNPQGTTGQCTSTNDCQVPEKSYDIPGSSYFTVIGRADTAYAAPIDQKFDANGTMIGAKVHELLGPVTFDSHNSPDGGPPLYHPLGADPEVIATLVTNLNFEPSFTDPILGTTPKPLPWGTSGTEIKFTKDGNVVGTMSTNVTEGNGFVHFKSQTEPIFQLLGFGPVSGGTGIFANASGMMSVSAAVTVFPAELSNVYTFRFNDPTGSLRTALRAAYS